MKRIFVNYRRDDTADMCGRIYDRLEVSFGREKAVKDVDTIRAGVDFKEYLRRIVPQCEVLLVVIGPRWLSITDANGQRRIDNPNDFVRQEIESALAFNVRVIPVLVQGAAMPSEQELPPTLRPLAFRQAITLRSDPDFRRDYERLVKEIKDRSKSKLPPQITPKPPTKPGFITLRRNQAIVGVLGFVVAVVVISALVASLLSHTGATTSHSSATCIIEKSHCPYTFSYQPTRSGKRGGTVTLGDTTFPQYINPITFTTRSDTTMMQLLYSSCLVELPDFTLGQQGFQPDQCMKMPQASSDLKTITIYLDPSKKWSDGVPITADDWIFSLQLQTDPKLYSQTYPLSNLSGFAKIDSSTITMTWKESYSAYLAFIASYLYPIPVHSYPQAFKNGAYDSNGAQGLLADKSFNTDPTSVNGPFMASTYVANDHVMVVRNPNYSSHYFPSPAIDSVIFKKAPSVEELISGFQSGAYDYAQGFTLPDVTSLASRTTGLLVSPQLWVDNLEFNTRTSALNASANGGASLFANLNVRKAFALAVDRCAALRSATNLDCRDYNLATNELSAPPAFDIDPGIQAPVFNVSAATGLLDAEGYKVVNGKRMYKDGTTPISLVIATTNESLREKVAQSLVAQWVSNLQVAVAVNAVPSSTLYYPSDGSQGVLAQSKWDLALIGVSSVDPDSVLTSYFQSDQIPSAQNQFGLNFSGISDPQIDDYLKSGRETSALNARTRTYQALQSYLVEQYYLEPLYIKPNIVLVKPTLGNYMNYPVSGNNAWNAPDWYLTS
jgi:ABC-type transport system substrate-binding protein